MTVSTNYDHADTLAPIIAGIASVVRTIATPTLIINRIFTEAPPSIPEPYSVLIEYNKSEVTGYDLAFLELTHEFTLTLFLRFKSDASAESLARQYVMPFVRAFEFNVDGDDTYVRGVIKSTKYGLCGYAGTEYYGLECALEVIDHQEYNNGSFA